MHLLSSEIPDSCSEALKVKPVNGSLTEHELIIIWEKNNHIIG